MIYFDPAETLALLILKKLGSPVSLVFTAPDEISCAFRTFEFKSPSSSENTILE